MVIACCDMVKWCSIQWFFWKLDFKLWNSNKYKTNIFFPIICIFYLDIVWCFFFKKLKIIFWQLNVHVAAYLAIMSSLEIEMEKVNKFSICRCIIQCLDQMRIEVLDQQWSTVLIFCNDLIVPLLLTMI